jgi:uncharacterized membrane protein
MSDQRLQNIADSAVLKVIQYVITAIAVPVIGWATLTVLDRIKGLEETIAKGNVTNATYEYRMLSMEKSIAQLSETNRLLADKVLSHDYEIRALKKAP